MIYRKWCMLTGTIAVTGGVAVAVIAADILFIKSGPFAKTGPGKGKAVASNR